MPWRQKMNNMLQGAKNRANNGKDYDVMNPEEENPNVSSAKKQAGKTLEKTVKAVGKAIAKIGKSIVHLLVGIGPVGWVILAILIILIIVSVIWAAWNMMPGMMKTQLSSLFKIEIDVDSWFLSGAVQKLNENDGKDIINVVNYLEKMDYSLIGDGFVTPELRNSSSVKTSEELLAKDPPEYQYTSNVYGKYYFYPITYVKEEIDEAYYNGLSDEAKESYLQELEGREKVQRSNITYYNSVGRLINNKTGEELTDEYKDEFGIIRSINNETDADENTRGKVTRIENIKNYRLIRSYLLSNYRIYTLKNTDESILRQLGDAFRTLGGNHDAWAKGLIKLYVADGGVAKGKWGWTTAKIGDSAKITGKSLILRNGSFSGESTYSIEGWAPRYGMSLDFLIALHLGTGAPDLVYAMLQNFDIEIQVYLDDSGIQTIDTRYVDPNGIVSAEEGITLQKMNRVLDEIFPGQGYSDWISWIPGNEYAFNLEPFVGQLLLSSSKLGIEHPLELVSPESCLQPDGVKCSDKDVSIDGDGNLDFHGYTEQCCTECLNYLNQIVKALNAFHGVQYSVYTPYIARVVGSWFRDTYFVTPDKADAAIKDYAGTIVEKDDEVYATKHPEFNVKNAYSVNATYVQVDEEYLGDTGEYWTEYEINSEGKYQLYVLKANGITSDTTMESFLANGIIDGEQATLDGETVTGYASQEEAENAGWAFVKKTKLLSVSELSTLGKDSERANGGLLWSAYGFTNDQHSVWEKATRSLGYDDINKLYDIIYGEESDGTSNSGIFYQKVTPNAMEQVEDAQRGETNALVKYLFKYRKFYLYDGGESRGIEIEHDKQRVLYGYENYCNSNYDFENKYYTSKVIADEDDIKNIPDELGITKENFYQYDGLLDTSENGNNGVLRQIYCDGGSGDWKGKVIDLLNNYGRSAIRQSYSWATIPSLLKDKEDDLASQWLDWQLDMYYMNKFGIDLKAYYHTDEDLLELKYDPRDPDLIGTVEITKSSLNVFSILENTESLDAEYAYRDLKELIVELNYFDREDLSEKIDKVFTWVLPEVSPVGWPNRPWDKLNVDYGSLMQSHDNYEALGVFDDENIDTSKLYFIGDSWTVGLVNKGLVDADRALARSGTNADSIGTPNPPDDSTGIVIAFGKNNVDDSGVEAIKTYVDKLLEDHPKLPVFILKLSYFGTEDRADMVDQFNASLQTYCASKSKVKFVDPTKQINDASTRRIKPEYNEPDDLHLNEEGYQVWYQSIIAVVKGNSQGMGTQDSTMPTPTSTGSSGSSFAVEDGDGDCSKIIVCNGIKYKQYDQGGKYGSVNVRTGDCKIRTDGGEDTLAGMGCGIYSTTSLMSAYVANFNPKTVVQWMHTNLGDSSFNNSGNRPSSMNKILSANGIPGKWYSGDKESLLKAAFAAKKPVIINMKAGSSVWTTSQGHYACFVGVSPDGKIYTADSVAGGGSRLCHDGGSDLNSAVSFIVSSLKWGSIWIPDQAPNGVVGGSQGREPFQGYEADQKVSSPVTGKVLEIGKHERLNVYSGEMEEVEYIKIKVMDTADYFDSRIDSSRDPEEAYGYKIEDDDEDALPLNEALNLFYEEYEGVCDGYVIMMDGFDVDFSVGDAEEDEEHPGNHGAYKTNTVYGLENTEQKKTRENNEKAKQKASFFINCGESEYLPGDTYVCNDPDSIVGYYVKEGKYIGLTTTSDETLTPVTSTEGESSEPKLSIEEKLTYTYEDFANVDGLTGDYIRIQITDTDLALVEDVERFFDIPERKEDLMLGLSISQPYQAMEGDLELLADVIMHEHCRGFSDEDKLYQASSMGYTVINKLLEDGKYWVPYWSADETTMHSGHRVIWAPDKSLLYNLVCRQRDREGLMFYAIAIHANCGDTLNLRQRAEQGKLHYSDTSLKAAEYCLTYDSTSLLNTGNHQSGYATGTPMPHTCWEQGANHNGGRIWIHDGDYLFDRFDK